MDLYKQKFIQTLAYLKEYLDQIVITGGWLPIIYREYIVKSKTRPSLMTYDVDIVVPDRLELHGEKTLDIHLLDSGFARKQASMGGQTVVTYEKRMGELDMRVEFLANLRSYGRDSVVEVQTGLHAQALRYISILRDNTMDIEIHDSVSCCGEGPAYVSRQRPVGVFPDLNEPQFRMYVISVFQRFFAELRSR